MPSSCRSKPVSSRNALARVLAGLGVHVPCLASLHLRLDFNEANLMPAILLCGLGGEDRRQSLWRMRVEIV